MIRQNSLMCMFFQKVTFGDKPAGCIAVTALRETTELFTDDGSRASEVLKEDTYMDDVVTSTDNLEDARKLEREIVKTAAKEGLNFKEFMLSKVGDQKELDLIGSNKAGKVLGVYLGIIQRRDFLSCEYQSFQEKQG